MAFLLVAYALVVEALLLAVAAFGLLWSPFGALVCARIAKSKGVPVAPNAIRGLVYSMLLFSHGRILQSECLGDKSPLPA